MFFRHVFVQAMAFLIGFLLFELNASKCFGGHQARKVDFRW